MNSITTFKYLGLAGFLLGLFGMFYFDSINQTGPMLFAIPTIFVGVMALFHSSILQELELRSETK